MQSIGGLTTGGLLFKTSRDDCETGYHIAKDPPATAVTRLGVVISDYIRGIIWPVLAPGTTPSLEECGVGLRSVLVSVHDEQPIVVDSGDLLKAGRKNLTLHSLTER